MKETDDRRPTILLVEDYEGDVFLFRRCLIALEAEVDVRVVGTPTQARQYLEGVPPYHDRTYYGIPDLIVIDLNLGGLSGLEIIEWLRLAPHLARIPTVVYSGAVQPDVRGRLVELGVAAVHLKAASFDAGKAVVAEMLKLIPR